MRSDELSYAVRPAALASVLGQLAAVLAGLTCVPLLVAVGFEDYAFAGRCAVVTGMLVTLAVAARRLPAPQHLQANEGLVASVLLFVFAPLLMAYPLAGSGLAADDAIFEAISAVTTTGLSMAIDIDTYGPAFAFTRSWMQWYGGLGFVVLSLALIVRPGPLARQLAVSSGDEGGILGSARLHGRILLMVYAILTLAGILLLIAMGVGLFPALVFVLSSVSTGGFSPRPDSLATIGTWPVQLAVLLVCCSGAVPLVAYYRGWRDGWRSFFGDIQLRAFVVALLVLTITMTVVLSLADGMSPLQALHQGGFQVLSAQSTTGFSTVDVSELSWAARLTLILAMFVGGSAGSTAGGIKLMRALGALQVVSTMVSAASLPPHAVVKARLGEQSIEDDEATHLLAIIVMFVAVVALSWLAFVFTGFAPMDSLFEIVSATGTVGLSTGITDPSLPGSLKAVLCVDMLLGRLEIVAVLVALYPRTWIGLHREV